MKKTIVVLALGLCFTLCGCVTQEDYDDLGKKLGDAKQEISLLKQKNGDLETQVENLEAENEDLQAQIDDLQAQNEELQSRSYEEAPSEDIPEEVIEDIEQEVDDIQLADENSEYRTDITYDDLSRRPDDYMGEYIEVSGTVIQLIEGDEENQIRVALNSNGYDDVILCGYEPSIVEERILEDDKITIKGISVGIFQYESTLGGLISVPAIFAQEITR